MLGGAGQRCLCWQSKRASLGGPLDVLQWGFERQQPMDSLLRGLLHERQSLFEQGRCFLDPRLVLRNPKPPKPSFVTVTLHPVPWWYRGTSCLIQAQGLLHNSFFLNQNELYDPQRWNMVVPALASWPGFSSCITWGAVSFEEARVLQAGSGVGIGLCNALGKAISLLIPGLGCSVSCPSFLTRVLAK